MMISLDILIIGGGIQGIWTLNLLTKLGYSALLITNNPVGNGQTLDSQVYIHKGHFYNNVEIAQHLKETGKEWDEFITTSCLTQTQEQSFLGFNHEDAIKWTQTWKEAGLEYHLIEHKQIPQAFQEGELKQGYFYKTNETCVNGEDLLRKLSEPVKDLIFQGEITSFKLNHGFIKEVNATIADESITFVPKSLVLTAGKGNQNLLNQITKDDAVLHEKTKNVQQLRRCQVLVLKGKELPSTSCLFPGFQLFAGCRKVNDENIWLITYGFDDPINLKLNSEIPMDKKRLQLCIKQLERVIPSLLQMDLDWGFYTAVKAESKALGGGVRPNEDFVDNCGLQNVLTVYPTKLSLAPRASHKIASKIQEYIGKGEGRFKPTNLGFSKKQHTIGKERWQTLDWLKWRDFNHTLLSI